MRIGFLFNHDQVHQVAHSLPIALALAKRRTGAEIILCSASERITSEIRILAGHALDNDAKLVELNLSRSSRVANGLAGRLIPSSKLLIYRDNLEFFKSLDVLVVAEKTSLILKDHFRLDHLKIIHTRHGAGDRAIGFDKASTRFDHVLAAGPKIRDRLVQEAGIAADKVSIVGYPKFDLFPKPVSSRQVGRRPVVVYNPHVAPHLSSWYKSGRAILQWFAAHPSYKLIFAPHVMLFERPLAITIQPPGIARPGSVRQSSFNPDDVLIDTRSRALTTMEYLNRADIYLGDASSQIYEFLVHPRPSLFFDAHGFDWKGDANFAHWRAGPVITEISELGDVLPRAFEDHDTRYRTIQDEMLRYTFDLRAKPSSERAADVILDVAGVRMPKQRSAVKQQRTSRAAAEHS